MDLSSLTKTVAKYGAPLLGAVLPFPGALPLGNAIAKIFGGDINDPKDLVHRIESDPDATVKLEQLQSNERIEIDRLAVETLKAENEDRANARDANNKNNKISDEIIKLYLVISMSIVVYMCLYALIHHDVDGIESNIISGLLGSAFTAILSMVYFYWGTSKSSAIKDEYFFKNNS